MKQPSFVKILIINFLHNKIGAPLFNNDDNLAKFTANFVEKHVIFSFLLRFHASLTLALSPT